MASKVPQSLFWKVALYYGVLIVLLLVLVGIVQPEWLKYLPVGGLDGLPDSTELTGEEFMLGQVMTSTQSLGFFENALNLFSAMIGSLIVAIPLRWVYMAKGFGKSFDPEIADGLLALPLVVTGIVFCIKYSLPLAFALVGILAGLRVKTELNSKSDSYFTFASIGVGLAIGAGYLAIALVLAAFFSLTMLVVTPVSTGYRTEI
ncbi:MAG: DUF4956 domain-containing protein [Gammaproteobacteria bacterium]|nr:DUF4956 domain-containing protein [Gammaproteobacteria bacterium]MDH3805054.1 DUF4956 domain-containing protein [Gammaproteobacteria bacterium]